MDADEKIYLAGHRGLVGSALARKLKEEGFNNVVGRTSEELDLTDQRAVAAFFEAEKPAYVFLAAARVGGILANATYPADFIYQNLAIQTNVLEQAYRSGVKKLLFLGSSCIYPRHASQPLKEEYLLTGPLEETNEAYAVAKIAGIKMCQAYNKQYGTNFISVMPTNLYGPNDNFDPEGSHVLAALLGKFHQAVVEGSPEVVVWGSGTPRREFLYVDDLASAALFLMDLYDSSEIINVGSGSDISILELAKMIKKLVGFKGRIVFDHSKPDGTPQKLLDSSKLAEMSWKPRYDLESGLIMTYEWFKINFIYTNAQRRPG